MTREFYRRIFDRRSIDRVVSFVLKLLPL